MNHDDHVWRFRNEQAGYHAFARRHWSEIPTRYSMRIDINASHRGRNFDDRIDDNQFSIENGDGRIY